MNQSIRNITRCHFGNKGRGSRAMYRKLHQPQSLACLFFDYLCRWSLFDLSIIRVTTTPLDTDVLGNDLPTTTKTLLALGNKFVPVAPFSYNKFHDAVIDFKRKVRCAAFFAEKDDEEKPCPKLPMLSLVKSSFNPKVNAYIENELEIWSCMLLEKARRIKDYGGNNIGFILSKAKKWLNEKYSNAEFLRTSADKNYGPHIVHHHALQRSYDQEALSGSYLQVSPDYYCQNLFVIYDQLHHLLEAAQRRKIIDKKTAQSILLPFIDLGIPNVNISARRSLLDTLGKIRFLIKLHKPGMKLRKLEVDTRSPLNNAATFVALILRNIARKAETVIQDSKEVLTDITLNSIDFEKELLFVAADLEDYFQRIKIHSGQFSLVNTLEKAIKDEYSNDKHASDFAIKIAHIVINNKFIFIGKKAYKKCDSLSTGERIATDAANIHRDLVFKNTVHESREGLLRLWGYVDDIAIVWQSTEQSLNDFLHALNSLDPQQFSWKFKVSQRKLEFLDLDILHDGKSFEVKTYRKPHFRPHYLHAASAHNPAIFKALVKSETERYLLNSSQSSDYYHDCSLLMSALRKAGYPERFLQVQPYSPEDRLNKIKNLRNRNNACAQSRQIVFKVQYASCIHKLGVKSSILSLKQRLEAQNIIFNVCTCYTNAQNLFLAYYRHNFPRTVRELPG